MQRSYLHPKNKLALDLEELKFPIGKYEPPVEISEDTISEWVSTLEKLPLDLRGWVENLSYESLDWVYRPQGWAIKQVVHHLADSHMNSFIRFKLILTEETPTIRPYNQDEWAKLTDGADPDIATSLNILEGLHARKVTLLSKLSASDWDRTFIHPEYDRELSLGWMVGLYAWHSQHHLAHIKQAIEKEGDFIFAE